MFSEMNNILFISMRKVQYQPFLMLLCVSTGDWTWFLVLLLVQTTTVNVVLSRSQTIHSFVRNQTNCRESLTVMWQLSGSELLRVNVIPGWFPPNGAINTTHSLKMKRTLEQCHQLSEYSDSSRLSLVIGDLLVFRRLWWNPVFFSRRFSAAQMLCVNGSFEWILLLNGF